MRAPSSTTEGASQCARTRTVAPNRAALRAGTPQPAFHSDRRSGNSETRLSPFRAAPTWQPSEWPLFLPIHAVPAAEGKMAATRFSTHAQRQSGASAISGCALASQHDGDSLGQNLQIEQKRPVARVPEVHPHHFVERHLASPFDLPETGNSGLDLQNAP
jgi:hypothetical protein